MKDHSPQPDDPDAETWQDVARDYRLEATVASMIALHLESQAAQCDLSAASMAGLAAPDLRAVQARADRIKAAADKAALPFREIAARILDHAGDELTDEQRETAQRVADHPARVFRDLIEPLMDFLRDAAALQEGVDG